MTTPAPETHAGTISSHSKCAHGSNVARLSSNGAGVAFSMHASSNARPSRPGRTLVRTARGFAALNLKYCGAYFRSPSASVYTTPHTSVCAPSSFRSCVAVKSNVAPGGIVGAASAALSKSATRRRSVCSSALNETSRTTRSLELIAETYAANVSPR